VRGHRGAHALSAQLLPRARPWSLAAILPQAGLSLHTADNGWCDYMCGRRALALHLGDFSPPLHPDALAVHLLLLAVLHRRDLVLEQSLLICGIGGRPRESAEVGGTHAHAPRPRLTSRAFSFLAPVMRINSAKVWL
jgi:hypothetical protein